LRYACRVAGIHPDTFNNWQVKHPELAEIVEDAKSRFIAAHLANVKHHARDQWTASMTLLERVAPEDFARPEAKIQIANFNGLAKADDPTTSWLEAVNSATTQSLPSSEPGETLTLEMPLPDPVELAKPVQALPAPHEVAGQTVEHEAEYDPHANSKMYLPDKELTALEHKMRYGFDKSQVPSQSRGLTVAARPSPPANPGEGGWDDAKMING
jgi:hypothetical protein